MNNNIFHNVNGNSNNININNNNGDNNNHNINRERELERQRHKRHLELKNFKYKLLKRDLYKNFIKTLDFDRLKRTDIE